MHDTSIFEQYIRDISQKFGEPERFLSWRMDMYRGAEILPDGLVHGLSIGLFEDPFAGGGSIGSLENGAEGEHVVTGGCVVLSWEEAQADEETAALLLDALENLREKGSPDRYAALNAAAFEKGMVVRCAKGLSGATRLTSSKAGDSRELTVVIADEGSDVSIFDDLSIDGGATVGKTVVIIARERARVRYTFFGKGDGAAYLVVHAAVHERAKVSCTSACSAGNAVIKIHGDAYLLGDGSSADMSALSFATHEGIVDTYTATHHEASHTSSELLASGIAAGKGTIIYRSDIFMNTAGTIDQKGVQKARFLLLSKGAEVDAIPALDIARKDVTCSHSVSIRKIRDDDTYYYRLRGIAEADARRMIAEGTLLIPSSEGDVDRASVHDMLRHEISSVVY